ncbi:MAG: sugar phosphate nucleotidyltransferase [Gemmatimonadota bacterium]
MSGAATCAIMLARGLGTRMRRDDAGVTLDPAQAAAAGRGLKMMMPDSRGRPFLDHLLSTLADGGVTDVCLVVAPDHSAIHDHFTTHPPTRLKLHFAVQAEPLGTANAVVAAESWLAGRDALVLNADNLYPVAAIRALVTLGEPGLVAFDPVTLVSEGNIDAARIAAFAIVALHPDGTLARIIEKPDAATLQAAGPSPWVSMNLWRFDTALVDACHAVPKSARGEFEIPDAIALAMARGSSVRAVLHRGGVLDLSSRGDVAAMAERLAHLDPRP